MSEQIPEQIPEQRTAASRTAEDVTAAYGAVTHGAGGGAESVGRGAETDETLALNSVASKDGRSTADAAGTGMSKTGMSKTGVSGTGEAQAGGSKAGGPKAGGALSTAAHKLLHDVTVQLPTALTGAPSRGDEPEPVFVDSSGGRRRLLRKFGWLLGVASLGYAVLLGISLAGGDAGAPDVLIPGPDKKASDKVDPSPSKSPSSAPDVAAEPSPDPSTPPAGGVSSAPVDEVPDGGAGTSAPTAPRPTASPPVETPPTKPSPPKPTPPKPTKTQDPPDPDPDPDPDPGESEPGGGVPGANGGAG